MFGHVRFQMSVINPSGGVNQTFGCGRDYTLRDSHILELLTNFATLVEVITSLCNVAGDGVHIPLGCGCDVHITVTVVVLTIL